jgi:competence protein ComEC
MPPHEVQVWKKAPFLRVLAAFIPGIVLQWYMQLPAAWLWTMLGISIIVITVFLPRSSYHRYRFAWMQGLLINLTLACTGALLAWNKDARQNDDWFGNHYKEGDALTVVLNESPVEKTRSIKAAATVSHSWQAQQQRPVTGSIIIYFKKDSSLSSLAYGTQLIFKKPLQEIRNSGNPGAFNYKRYCLFNGITHQVYLQPGEFEINPVKKENWLSSFIIRSRKWVLHTLRENITDSSALGLAEALLIGYKDDLDKNLVQSYTDTGVVHVIAISGLHLGLIYWLLSIPFRSLKRNKRWKWLPPLVIITGLWLFSLLAGAQPSVLRSALMFSCIVIGESLSRRTSVFNALAASAFILLCINPYWLWDTGFQLSYSAVLSIIIFNRVIYHWFYFENKLIDLLWQLNAVTLAAQILTLPVCMYHFHQFPNYFLFANLVAVPLSSFILVGEIALCAFSVVPLLASWIGKAMEYAIIIMNSYIEIIERLPWAVWQGLEINVLQVVLLLLFIAGVAHWLMAQSIHGLKWALLFLFGFMLLRVISFVNAGSQAKIIVYNIPRKKAIDVIDGRHHFFIGDSSVPADASIRRFHLQPSRILYRAANMRVPSHLWINGPYIQYGTKHILLLDRNMHFSATGIKQTIDLLLVSGNPKIDLPVLCRRFDIRQVVFDATVSTGKKNRWKTACDSLRIAWHDVMTKGAFVMNLR